MTKHIRNFLLVLGFSVLPSFAANLTGSWTIDGEIAGNEIKAKCELKQEAAKLTGTCRRADGSDEPAPVQGEVTEGKAAFHYDVVHEGTTYTLMYTGKLDGETAMKGDVEAGGAAGEFTAKKN